MFSLSPIYSARKSSNHKLSTKHKIGPITNLHKIKHTASSKSKTTKFAACLAQSTPKILHPLIDNVWALQTHLISNLCGQNAQGYSLITEGSASEKILDHKTIQPV